MVMEKMSIRELESIIARYPWFSLARRELFLKFVEMDSEIGVSAIRKIAPYVFSRGRLISDASIVAERVVSQKTEALKEIVSISAKELEPDSLKVSRDYYIIGGDYFSKEDFEEIKKTETDPIQSLKWKPVAVNESVPERDLTDFSQIEDEEFCTETLAGIYASQGHSQRAIDLYAKLILLYPEKSTYFASLINEIRKNN